MTDDTKIIKPEDSGCNEQWRVCSGGAAKNFTTEEDANAAAYLCKMAYQCGRRRLARELRQLLGAADR